MNVDRPTSKAWEDCYPQIRRVVSRLAMGSEHIDDIAQECFVRLIEKEGLYSGQSQSLKGWINAVVRSVTFNYLKKEKKYQSNRELMDEDHVDSPNDDISEEQIRWVFQQFSSLPEDQKNLLHLRYHENLTTTEMAECLGISQPAVSKKLKQTIEGLQRQAKLQQFFGFFIPWRWSNAAIKVVSLMTKINKIKLAIGATIILLTASSLYYFSLDDIQFESNKWSLDKSLISDNRKESEVIDASTASPMIFNKNSTDVSIVKESVDLASEYAAQLRGRVLLQGSNQPLDHAKVTVWFKKMQINRWEGWDPIKNMTDKQKSYLFSDTTDKDGNFLIKVKKENLSDQNLTFHIEGPHFKGIDVSNMKTIRSKPSGEPFVIKGDVSPLLDGDDRVITIYMKADPVINIAVNDSFGLPIPGVQITYRYFSFDGGYNGDDIGKTNEQGQFSFFHYSQDYLNRHKVSVSFCFKHPQYRFKWVHNVIHNGVVKNSELNVVLLEGLSLEGKVYDDQNRLLSNVTLMAKKTYLANKKSFGWSHETKTNKDGLFEFSNFDEGDYEIRVTAPGFKEVYQTVTIDEREPNFVEFNLAKGAVITGRVWKKDSSGAQYIPDPKASVRAIPKDKTSRSFASGHTDAQGYFFLDSLNENQIYEVHVHTHQGFVSKEVKSGTENLEFGKEKACRISLEFKDKVSKKYIKQNGRVDIFFGGSSSFHKVTTGRAMIHRAIAGSNLALYIRIDGYEPVKKIIDVPKDVKFHKKTIELSVAASISGRVTSGVIDQFSQISVRVLRTEEGVIDSHNTIYCDEDGNFLINSLLQGISYQLVVSHPQAVTALTDVFNLDDSEQGKPLKITLKSGGVLKGQVTRENALSSAGIVVILKKLDIKQKNEEKFTSFTSTTQIDGMYGFTHVPEGQYELIVENFKREIQVKDGKEEILDVLLK